MWIVIGLAAAVAVLTGWLPASTAHEVAISRGAPVLGFLVAITVLAELSDRAGVFDAAALRCARLARGSTFGLFILVAVLGALMTTTMSLDTTAVLLTPVVLSLTQRLGLNPLPFAILVVWLANTTSLLLPISNLTNLLALQREHLTTIEFARQMFLPAAISLLITVAYLATLFRRQILGRYVVPDVAEPRDNITFIVCAIACVLLAPAVMAGITPWVATAPLATAAVVVYIFRNPSVLRPQLLPWRVVIFTTGLFLIVAAISLHGMKHVLTEVAGTSPTRTAATAAVTSNVANNLPTYLAMEDAVPAGHTQQLLAALLGTNIGPLVLVWGSLATILWQERCRARGVYISAKRFAFIGMAGVPLVLGGSLIALLVQ